MKVDIYCPSLYQEIKNHQYFTQTSHDLQDFQDFYKPTGASPDFWLLHLFEKSWNIREL